MTVDTLEMLSRKPWIGVRINGMRTVTRDGKQDGKLRLATRCVTTNKRRGWKAAPGLLQGALLAT